MSWIQIEIKTPYSRCECVEAFLMENGACSVTFLDAQDHPIYEPSPGETPLWQEMIVQGLFSDDADVDTIALQLKEREQQLGELYGVQTLEDKVWETECLRDFEPMHFGKKLWICPDWCSPPDPEAVNVMLNPGCGFGTGTHPTTAMCLEWLANHDLDDLQVVDYGCGSGILGISAALLGASQVTAVDIDSQALDASRENAKKNGLKESRFKAVHPDRIKSAIKADILIANILSGPLVDLAEKLASMIKQGGYLVLSGILESQADSVKNAYTPWLSMESIHVQEGWVRLSGIKKSL